MPPFIIDEAPAQPPAALQFIDALRLRAASDAEETERIGKYVQEFNWFRDVRSSTVEPIWNECYRAYRLQTPDERKSGEWRSKINGPYAFTNVEDVTPHLMAPIFDSNPLFKIQSDKDPDMARAHERLISHQVDKMHLELEWLQFQKQKALYGTSFGFPGFKSVYRDKRIWAYETNPFDPTQRKLVQQRKKMPEYIGPYFKTIDVFSIYVHPLATPWAPRVMYWEDWFDMKWLQDAGIFKNLDKLAELSTTQPNSLRNADVRSSLIGKLNNNDSGRRMSGEYRVIFRFDDINKRMCVYVEDSLEIYEGDYLYWDDKCPIIEDRFTTLPNEYYGVGVIEPSTSLIHEANTVRNQRRDNLNLILNSALEININDIDMDETELVSRPGMLYFSRTGNAVRPIVYPMITQDSYMEESKIAAEIKGVTGLGGALAGASDPEKAAASAISLTQKAQLLRLKQANRQQAVVFADLIERFFAMNCQFYPTEMAKEVLAPLMFEQYYTLAPESIAIQANIRVEPAGVYENEDILRQQLINLTNIMGANPVFAQKLDWDEWFLRILKAHNITDAASVLKNNNTVDFMETMFAHQENVELAMGAYVPPALPNQNENMHLEIHNALLKQRPDLFMQVGQHIQTHNQAVLDRQRLMIEAMSGEGGGADRPHGPGSAPSGSKGGVNPQRQPHSTSQEGMQKAQGRIGNANA